MNINIHHHLDRPIYWWKLRYISMNQFVILLRFHAHWKQILPGACSSPRLQYLRDYGVLRLLIAHPWISLYHSQFYVLHWHSSSLSAVSVCCMLPRLSCLLMYHNDVIDAGHNNRLFGPGTSSFIEYQNKKHAFNWLNIPQYRLGCWYRLVQKPYIDWCYQFNHGFWTGLILKHL